MIYLLLYFSLIVTLPFSRRNIGAHLYFVWPFILVLCFILTAGLRDGVGDDFYSYKEMYDFVGPLFSYESISSLFERWSHIHGENGYLFLNSLAKTINLDFNGLLIIFSSLGFICITSAIFIYRANVFLSLYLYISLYYVPSHFVQIRIGLVIAVFLLITWFIYINSFWKYLASLLIIATVHKLALFAIPVYFIRFRLTNLTSLVLIFFAYLIQESFFNIIGVLGSNFVDSNIIGLSQIYYYTTTEKYINSDTSMPFTSWIFVAWFYFSTLHVAQKNFSTSHPIFILLRMFLLGIILIIAFQGVSILAGRLFSLFSIGLIIFTPLCFVSIKSYIGKIVYVLPFVIYCSFKYIKIIYFVDESYMIPYNSVL